MPEIRLPELQIHFTQAMIDQLRILDPSHLGYVNFDKVDTVKVLETSIVVSVSQNAEGIETPPTIYVYPLHSVSRIRHIKY